MDSFSSVKSGFKTYLRLERGMSENTMDAYLHDVDLLFRFLTENGRKANFDKIQLEDLQKFIVFINDMELGPNSQARVISGIKSFFNFLAVERMIIKDPTELLESPQLGKKLPEYLTIDEIDSLIAHIDLSTETGERNMAIIETLYGCGLRVSELINLKISDLHFREGIVLVTGKGNKQRLVPLGFMAKKQLEIYLDNSRRVIVAKKKADNLLFLNRRGDKLSRQMIFLLIKSLVEKAGIRKNVSPHTFRHSYATHLVQNGAHLRAVQELLGHVSITTTEIYTHLNVNDLGNAILKYHPRNTSY
jgi:integrase/recombinase XerD